MKKRAISFICIFLAMVLCFGMGVAAAGNLETISAYLNHGITIKLDGVQKTLYDASGNPTSPITYQGTTYIPLRSISNLIGLDVQWDGANNTVLLGDPNAPSDFIEILQPYHSEGAVHWAVKDRQNITIAEKTYNHFIRFERSFLYNENSLYYDLAGNYDKLTFKAYSDYDDVIYFYGDNDTLLAAVNVVGKAVPQTVTIDLNGTQQLVISANLDKYLYMFDMTIE